MNKRVASHKKVDLKNQLSFNFTFTGKNYSSKNEQDISSPQKKIVSINYSKDSRRKELLRHIIYNEKTF